MAVVDEYIRSAEPVASKIIAESYELGVSPATVRNDMMALEEAGFLRQPHTSSGRIPTEEGYRFYLTVLKRPKTAKVMHKPLQEIEGGQKTAEHLARNVAHALVELSGETAFARISNNWSHYTGISKLFEKPDFGDVETLRSLSSVIDRFDDVMTQVFEQADRDMHVWIGQENPFGEQMATILVKYTMPNGITGVLGLVGPQRMQYKRNIALLEEARTILERIDEL